MCTFTVFAREQIAMRRPVHQPFSTYSTFKMISTKFDSEGRETFSFWFVLAHHDPYLT
jgi:hypothetical protein